MQVNQPPGKLPRKAILEFKAMLEEDTGKLLC